MKKVKTKLVMSTPVEAKLLVGVGSAVNTDDVLAEVSIREEKIVKMGSEIFKLKDLVLGKFFKKDDCMGSVGGFFKKKILSPIDGEVTKIDEYGNVYFSLQEEKIKKITCPTEAIVVQVEEGSITLEFSAIEFNGIGLVEGRVWGKKGLKVADKVTDLSAFDEDTILITRELNQTMLAKADAIGISGVIVMVGDKINFSLPILKVEIEEYNNILSEAANVKRAMLNTNNGRLLLVV